MLPGLGLRPGFTLLMGLPPLTAPTVAVTRVEIGMAIPRHVREQAEGQT
jgi:hypothetical protein